MRHDLALKHLKLPLARQLAIDEQIRRLEVCRARCELLDRIAAVAQHARVAVNVRDLALYDGRVEEAPVGHAEALGRLVLRAFPRLQRGGDRLERRGRYRVVLDPVTRAIPRLSLTGGRPHIPLPSLLRRKAPKVTYGIVYVFPVRLSRTVRLSSIVPLVSAGRPMVEKT